MFFSIFPPDETNPLNRPIPSELPFKVMLGGIVGESAYKQGAIWVSPELGIPVRIICNLLAHLSLEIILICNIHFRRASFMLCLDWCNFTALRFSLI
jgi:hypothetical protein